MLASMTAFARCESRTQQGVLSWELRSVNHRFLEVSLRLPEEWRGLEMAAREQITSRLGRGKVDATLRFQPAEADGGERLQLDSQSLTRLIHTLQDIEAELENPSRISAMELLRWPGVLHAAQFDMEALQQQVLALLEKGLDELVANRGREGDKIRAMLLARCDAIAAQREAVQARFPQVIAAQRARLQARLDELLAQPDRERLEQEIVYLVQKQDVEEELDRLQAHLEEARRIVAGDGPAGRRLDFLMQELNREVNTLASKSADQQLTHAALEMKVLVEQMREQIQNVE